MNNTPIILHAMFFRVRTNVSFLSLSTKYHIELNQESKTVLVRAPKPNDLEALPDSRFASFHTLYGENGCGKTKLLLSICENFGKSIGKRTFGVLFEREGSLELVQGQALGGWRVEGVVPLIKKAPPSLLSIFYTSSPFEYDRRTALRSLDVVDASPRYSDRPSHDIRGLIAAYPYLKGRGTFADQVRVGLKVRLPEPREFLGRLEQSYREGTQLSGLLAPQKQLFLRLTELLPLEQRTKFAIELAIALKSRTPADFWENELWNIIEAHRDIIIDENFDAKFATRIYKLILAKVLRRRLDWAGPRAASQIIAFVRRKFLHEKHSIYRLESLQKLFDVGGDQAWSEGGLLAIANEIEVVNLNLKRLSSGQAAFIQLYASLAKALWRAEKQAIDKPLFVMVDEGEMFLHPRWQQEYISTLLEFVGSYRGVAPQAHILISTHSLIVAADAPPRSLFDMDKGVSQNGFGLGPASILSKIYGVERFAGSNASSLIDIILRFLKGESEPEEEEKIPMLVRQLEDATLRSYVERKMEEKKINVKVS